MVKSIDGYSHIQLVGGADFSAANERPGKPNATWLALGELKDKGEDWEARYLKARETDFFGHVGQIIPSRYDLNIFSLEKTGSGALAEKILKAKSTPLSTGELSKRSTFGLDFPFSLPKGFMAYLEIFDIKTIHELPFEKLEALTIEYFKLRGGEERRCCDLRSLPTAQSPLHRVNPGMLKMTHTGAQVLTTLHAAGMDVLPWDLSTASTSKLMEVYPAAILHWFCLPYQKYKGKGPEPAQLRQQILNGLCKLHTVNSGTRLDLKVVLEPTLRTICLSDDDALDAVIACIGAAIAVCHPLLVSPPARPKRRKNRRSAPLDPKEGWIYSPWQYLA